MAVLDIRGTHGSGKSWIMYRLLRKYRHTLIKEDGERLGYHLKSIDTGLLGKYATTSKSGGCDCISKADEVVRRVRLFAKHYHHVLLEGIFVAHTFQRYSDLAKELEDYGYTFFFLNTPKKRCIQRVRERRERQGNLKPPNTENLEENWHRIWERIQPKCVAAGHDVVVLDWKRPLVKVLEKLRS